jgi:hypothetical protein
MEREAAQHEILGGASELQLEEMCERSVHDDGGRGVDGAVRLGWAEFVSIFPGAASRSPAPGWWCLMHVQGRAQAPLPQRLNFGGDDLVPPGRPLHLRACRLCALVDPWPGARWPPRLLRGARRDPFFFPTRQGGDGVATTRIPAAGRWGGRRKIDRERVGGGRRGEDEESAGGYLLVFQQARLFWT